MSASADVALVRGIYEAFNQGNLERVEESFDERILWVEPQRYFVPEGQGETVGRERVMALLARYPDYWQRFEVKPVEVFDAGGGNVFVLGRQVAHGHGGRTYEGTFANLWRVRDGRAVEHRSFSDTKALDEAISG